MDKQALYDYMLKIIEKIASLQQLLLDVPIDGDKQKIIAGYYDLADSILQLESGLVQLYNITDDDVALFERYNFLQDDENGDATEGDDSDR